MERIPWRSTAGACALLGLFAAAANAADHTEAPGTTADPAADIDDLYAWYEGDKIIIVLTFGGAGAGPDAPPAAYDPDVLYGIHVDNTGDSVPEHDIWVRFGQASDGTWGVQLANVPGAAAVVEGEVGAEITLATGLRAQAGVFDDPFFFDFTGFVDTLSTSAVSFDSTRDSFAGKNVNAIVFEMDSTAARGASNDVHFWATTGRK